jgi:hypothetical protein
MALPSTYNTGTATVASGGTAVTGQGTAWVNSVKAGDRFGTHKGLGIRILSVNSNTSLTLAYAAPALLAQTAAAYEIAITPVSSEIQASVRALLEKLLNGNLDALAGLTGEADKVPYFTGAGTMALATITALARNLLNDSTAAEMLATLGAPGQEVGLWTPGFAGSTAPGNPTYVAQLGSYVRIGKQVMAHSYLVMSALGGPSGQLTITNLPFTVGSGTQRRSLWQPTFTGGLNLPDTTMDWNGFGIGNDTNIRLYRNTLNTSPLSITEAHVSGTLTLYGTTVYETN